MIKKIFRNKTGDFYFDLFIAGFIIAIFLASFNLSKRAVRLPFLIGTLTLLFIVIDCIIMATAERNKKIESGKPEDKKSSQKTKVPLKKILITLCFMIATVVLWQLAGFIISSILVTVGFGIFLGAKNKIILTTILTLGLYWIFSVFLGVPLPTGLL